MANFWEQDTLATPAEKPFWEADAAAKPTTPTPQEYAKTFTERAQKSGDPNDIQMAMMADKDAARKPDFMSGERLDYGFGDPVYGAAQFGAHVIPGIDPSGIDKRIQDREAEYNAKRTAAGQTGHDWYRTGGNLAASTPLMLAMPAAAPESLMGAIGQGAGIGTVNSIMQPVTSGKFWEQKPTQMLEGATTGALTSGGAYGLGRLVGGAGKPVNDYEASVQRLQSKGVTPTLGQMAGPNAAKFEDVAQPFSVFGQQRAVKQLNEAAYQTALDPLNALDKAAPSLPRLSVFDGKAGRGGLSAVYDKLSAAYDRILPNVGFKADAGFNQGLQGAEKEISFASPAIKEHYANVLKEQILPRIDSNGTMSGTAFKALEEELSKQIGRLQPKGGDEAALADAFDGVLDAFRENLVRNNPQYGSQLQAVNSAYSRFADLRRAVAQTKNADGTFTPAGLWGALKAGDKSAGKFVTAEGKGGDLQELALDALRVMGEKYPNSGTPARLAVGALEGGGLASAAAAHPIAVGSVAATGLAYTPWGQKAASAMLGPRQGQVLPLMGKALKASASPLAIGTSNLFPRLMGP